jgi:hypothetical protein
MLNVFAVSRKITDGATEVYRSIINLVDYTGSTFMSKPAGIYVTLRRSPNLRLMGRCKPNNAKLGLHLRCVYTAICIASKLGLGHQLPKH